MKSHSHRLISVQELLPTNFKNISLMKKQFVITHRYTTLYETQKT